MRKTASEKSGLKTARGSRLPGPPDNIKGRVDEGNWFHSEGPMKAKARDLAIAVPARGTRRSIHISAISVMYAG